MKKLLITFLFLLTLLPLTSHALSFPTKIDTKQERINIQTVLNTVMYPSPGLVVDGVLGKKSIQAIQAFQESRGLVPDGKIGPITRSALESAQTNTTTTTYTTGCFSGALYNTITGQPCTTSSTSLSAGCTGTNKFSTITGKSCNVTTIKGGGDGGGGGSSSSGGGSSNESSNNVGSTASTPTTTTPDTTPPTITSFTIPGTSSSLTVPISSFTASDNTGVTGYLLKESSSTPNASSGSWSTSAPSIYTFLSQGIKTLYAWAKDLAGNVSTSVNRSTTITTLISTLTTSTTTSTLTSTSNCDTGEYLFAESGACLLQVSGNTYFVSTTGNDNNPGTFSQPWGTLQKAFNTANTGDITYFRGGVYYMTKGAVLNPTYLYWQNRFGNNGTANAPIRYFNYPGERPIFDGTYAQDDYGYLIAIGIECAHFISFKGFEIRNFSQRGNHWWVGGISAQLSSNLRFENISVHDIGGRGFFYLSAVGDRRGYDYLPADYPEPVTFWRYWDENYPVYIASDSTYFINCDAYNLADSVSVQEGGSSYNMADGFKLAQTAGGHIYVEGCRAWNVSDDGFDINGSTLGVFKNNWAFNNGWYPGVLDGNGFKYGFIDDYDYSDIGSSDITRIMTNNLAAFNYNYGFADLRLARAAMLVANNTSYKNHWGFIQGVQQAVGNVKENWFRNNLSYDNIINSLMEEASYESNNTWGYCAQCQDFATTDIIITDDDFTSLDVSQLSAPRKADGSLPDITFGHLTPGSDLIDSGIDVGLPYNGSAPDIGAFEY